MIRDADAREAVKTNIRAAFADTPPVGDDDLVVGQDALSPGCRDIVSAFAGRRWTEIPARTVRDHGDALPVFTRAAFRHFLPAWLLLCADAYANPHVDVGPALDGVIFNLTPPADPDSRNWFDDRTRQFSDGEADAIRSFLEFMDCCEHADYARVGLEQPDDRVRPALIHWTNRSSK